MYIGSLISVNNFLKKDYVEKSIKFWEKRSNISSIWASMGRQNKPPSLYLRQESGLFGKWCSD